MAIRVILDTDIGTDVDDIVALSLILTSPEFKLEGVTCVYGDVLLRARMVMKMLKLRGREDVPVMMGSCDPIMRLQPIYWAGHEGEGLLTPEDDNLQPESEHAADYIVRTVMENPGEIHLIAIGPLTNVAQAFLREPRIADHLQHLTIMGGVVRGYGRFDLPYAEHNIKCDVDAAHIVMSSGAPITLIPLDVTTQVQIRKAGVQTIHASNTPFHDALAKQVEKYFTVRGIETTSMHDPLAVASIIQPELVTPTEAHIDVETQGRVTQGATVMHTPSRTFPANARVALDVDAEAFETFLISRLKQ
jgi:purine nucleosidase